MSDPLTFSWASTPALWCCYWDPEGPSAYGRTKEIALSNLIDQCDDQHRADLLAGAIVAALKQQYPKITSMEKP